ncbi:MAG: hypothetical protein NWE94_03580 [Candidatus Bathyarchaeota archaeon]|nr:hypothetical protein [Candidatus Bathyarchaeota archaeon]
MKTRTPTAAPHPPSPPSKKDSRKLLVAALLLIIIIVSAGVLFYLSTSQSSANPTPTPSTAPTATPTPTGSNQMTNFKAGTWVNYTATTYTENGTAIESRMNYAVAEGSHKGVACWLLKIETLMTENASIVRTLTTYWINKYTLEGVHFKTQAYMDGQLLFEDEDDISPGASEGIPNPINLSTATSYETITVPAGTFNCGKITITSTVAGTKTTTTQWASANVPILGLVKQEVVSGGSLLMKMELMAYGG